MKKLLFILLLCAGMSFGQSAPSDWGSYASPGALCDAGPDVAATLLVPYFEVNSADNSGMDTLVGVTNISPFPYVAHVVVWNVDSWPVFFCFLPRRAVRASADMGKKIQTAMRARTPTESQTTRFQKNMPVKGIHKVFWSEGVQ